MIIKRIYCVLCTMLIATIITQSVCATENNEPLYINNRTLSDYCGVTFPGTVGKSIFVYNTENNLSIYEKNSNVKVFPASTVKIMTAIIAYEKIEDKSTPITVTKSVVNESTGIKLGLAVGDVYTAEDLIRAILICGSNDAANLIADYVSGNDKGRFISLMNEKAELLGCKETNFTNVTGLHDENMYTTVSDMMKIAIYAYQLGELAEWSSVPTYSFAPINNPDNYKLRYNRNDFVSKSSTKAYYYPNALGLSSGYTPEAGECLITSASKNGLTYICVIMNCHVAENDDVNYAYIDAKQILNTCFSAFSETTVLTPSSVIDEVPLKLSASKDYISLYPSGTVKHLLPIDMKDTDISYEKIIYKQEYEAPVAKGDELGEIIVKYKGDYILGKVKLVSAENFERSAVLYAIESIKKIVTSSFFIVTVITAVILFIIYTVISLKSRKNGNYRYK